MYRLTISLLAVTGLAAMLSADAWNKKTELTVNENIQVPGATLTPGKYVVKLVDSQSNRHIVQFTNEREDQVISTVLAIPNQRLQPTGESEFSFYETTVGGAPAMRAWFYPGDSFGQEFAYPEQTAMQLAKATGENVPSVSDADLKSAQATTAAPAEQKETTVSEAAPPAPPRETAQARTQPAVPREEQPRPDPTIMAQAQPQPTPRQQATPTPQPGQPPAADEPEEPSELPATASPAPLLGLLGLLSLGGAFALRRLGKTQGR